MGDFLIKKFVLVITLAVFLLSFNASAKKYEVVKSIEPQGEFYIYGEDNDELSEILLMDKESLDNYCHQNGVHYLAVNADNTKQIKVTASVTDFSNSVINISSMSNDSITALIPDITGVDGAKGEVINKDGQKFVKTQFKTSDSGGEYILTEYFTVADKSTVVLSFYTKLGLDTDYIEKTFNSFNSPLFIVDVDEVNNSPFSIVLLVAAGIFGIACVIILITILRDIKKEKVSEESMENDN
jgi:hypothetical protein